MALTNSMTERCGTICETIDLTDGKTVHPLNERRQFVSLDRLATELERVKGIAADYATFSGVGEPTLAYNLGEAIELVGSTLRLPVAVLTNSLLMVREDVRHELSLADVVVAKVDAPNEELFRQINQPVVECTLDEIIRAITLFREGYRGKLALQVMFIEANKGCASEMARLAEQFSPDEVQLNTPLRPCAVQPLTPEDIRTIRQAFSGFRNVLTVYESPIPEVATLNPEETQRRRPREHYQQGEISHGNSKNHTL